MLKLKIKNMSVNKELILKAYTILQQNGVSDEISNFMKDSSFEKLKMINSYCNCEKPRHDMFSRRCTICYKPI